MDDEQYAKEYGQHLVEMVQKGKMTRRQLLVRASVFGLSASAAGSLLAACGSSSSSSTASPAASSSSQATTPKAGGTVNVSCPDTLTALNPVTMYDVGGAVMVQQVCDYLIWVNNDMTLRPVLAESWSSDPTAKVWTIKLRQGVTFNDGSPFGADDVVATMDRLTAPNSGSSALTVFKGILSPGGTVKVDDSTVAFHLDSAFADFPYLISSSNYNTVILPRNWSGDFLKSPVGTGAFMLQQYTHGVGATFVKNPNYWQKAQGLPYLDKVVFKFAADDQAATLQLQAGAVDMQCQTPYQGSQALFQDPNLNIVQVPGTGFREVAMRVDKAPFTDKRVRQAIAYCLNRPSIIQGLFGGRGTIGNDTVFSSLFPNSPVLPQRAQDYAKAKSLLAAAGHPNGIDITITTEQYLEVPQYATLIQAMCKPANINVKIQLISYNDYYSGTGNNQPWLQAPMDITDWAPRPAAIQFVDAMLLSTSVWNSSHFADPTYDKLAAQYAATVDESSRLPIATKMATIENDETPEILAFWITQLSARAKKLHDVGGINIYLDLSRAYIS
jgi:peptide/nickel transport system substrate-binding protein